MIVKSIKSRLPQEFAQPIADMCEAVGFPFDFEKGLASVRETFAQVVEQALEMSKTIEGVTKEVMQVKSPDDNYDIPLFIYTPENQSEVLPVFYWMHGGGLVLGQAEQDEFVLRNFVKDMNCVEVAVDYRLAPDYSFPIPLKDCYTGLEYVFDEAEKLNIDTSHIVVGGASAGGGLAAALAQITCDRDKIPLVHQLLLYPMLDPLNITQAGGDIDDTYIWTRANNLFGWTSYLGQKPEEGAISKYASALYNHDLTNLPPATIMVGDIDLFAQECTAYAAKLSAAGIPTELHVYPGGVHCFEDINPETRIAQNFLATRDSVLKAALEN
ncbi:MAG: alpha/beta hydrolase [Chlorobiales bacterium]|nr:alpha/beta hydrolase [Chlorobiales bacterium]